MHLSAHTRMRPEPLETTLIRLSKLGYSSIELEGEPSLHPIGETRSLLAKYNIKCWGTVTSMQGIRDLTAPSAKERQETVEYMKEVVSLSAALGGEVVSVVPARLGKVIPTGAPEQEWKWVVEGLREVASFAKSKGIRIGLEPMNRYQTYFLNRTDQALALADEVGYGCGISFDTFHLALEEKDMLDTLRKCRSRIIDFHVADNNRLAAGDGSLNWTEIIAALKEADYDGALAVECMPPIDRSPVGGYGLKQIETGLESLHLSVDRLQSIIEHGSVVFSDNYYTYLMKRSAETLLPFV